MGAILGLTFAGIGVLLILWFFVINRWSSSARDRDKDKALRDSRQMGPTNTEERGTGIN
jgi:hypothetical protein